MIKKGKINYWIREDHNVKCGLQTHELQLA